MPETALAAGGNGDESTLFVLQGTGEQSKAVARQVTIGEKKNGNVEVESGLQPGDIFVVRSSKPLKDGESVRLSILSEKSS